MRQASAGVEDVDVVDGNSLDAVDPVEPVTPGELDFLRAPRTLGKRIPVMNRARINMRLFLPNMRIYMCFHSSKICA